MNQVRVVAIEGPFWLLSDLDARAAIGRAQAAS
jgi:hypothetical protein